MTTPTISARTSTSAISKVTPSEQTTIPVQANFLASPIPGTPAQEPLSNYQLAQQILRNRASSESSPNRVAPDSEHLSSPASPGSQPKDDPRAKSTSPVQSTADSSPKDCATDPEHDPYAGLAFAAQVLDDLEALRVANENRLRQLTRTEPDEDGGERGLGLSVFNPTVIAMQSIVDGMNTLEEQGIKELERLMKRHPLGPWVKAQTGIGFKQAARLLGAIGDPYMRESQEFDDGSILPAHPRTVSQLWAYSGYSVLSGESQKRRKGQLANWSDDARKRAWLISASCVKQKPGTKWRDLYDASRAKYADAVHPVDCVRCGPKGKPALAGSPLSAGHQHARALRIMSKEILKEMWAESKRIHES